VPLSIIVWPTVLRVLFCCCSNIYQRALADTGREVYAPNAPSFLSLSDRTAQTGFESSGKACHWVWEQGRLTQRARRARAQGPEPQGPQTAHALFFVSCSD